MRKTDENRIHILSEFSSKRLVLLIPVIYTDYAFHYCIELICFVRLWGNLCLLIISQRQHVQCKEQRSCGTPYWTPHCLLLLVSASDVTSLWRSRTLRRAPRVIRVLLWAPWTTHPPACTSAPPSVNTAYEDPSQRDKDEVITLPKNSNKDSL